MDLMNPSSGSWVENILVKRSTTFLFRFSYPSKVYFREHLYFNWYSREYLNNLKNSSTKEFAKNLICRNFWKIILRKIQVYFKLGLNWEVATKSNISNKCSTFKLCVALQWGEKNWHVILREKQTTLTWPDQVASRPKAWHTKHRGTFLLCVCDSSPSPGKASILM